MNVGAEYIDSHKMCDILSVWVKEKSYSLKRMYRQILSENIEQWNRMTTTNIEISG